MTAWLRVMVFGAIAAAGYIGTNLATPTTMGWLAGTPCTAHWFQAHCTLAKDGAFDPLTYAVVLACFAVLLLISVLVLRRSSAYPLLMLFGMLGLCAAAYDVVFRHALLDGPKLVNDTMNVLRFAILASFTLTFAIARRHRLSPAGVLLGVIGSYGAAQLALAAFLVLDDQLIGAFELYMLYVVYAFAAFTLHLMTVSLLISQAPQDRPPGLLQA
jgi:hypothetical protein